MSRKQGSSALETNWLEGLVGKIMEAKKSSAAVCEFVAQEASDVIQSRSLKAQGNWWPR